MNGWRRSHNTGKPFASFFHTGRDFRVNCTVEEVLKIGGLDAKLVKFSWISCALESYTVPVYGCRCLTVRQIFSVGKTDGK